MLRMAATAHRGRAGCDLRSIYACERCRARAVGACEVERRQLRHRAERRRECRRARVSERVPCASQHIARRVHCEPSRRKPAALPLLREYTPVGLKPIAEWLRWARYESSTALRIRTPLARHTHEPTAAS